MIRRFAFALGLLLLTPAPAAAQRWPDQQCVENPNLASCVQSRGDQLAATFGARRIDEHRDAGEEVVRVFYYHDEDLALVAFVRAPGHEPTAYVYFPRRAGQPAPAPMQAPIPQAVWAEAMWRSIYADRGLAPAPPIPSDGDEVCLHPWNYVFEASVPAAPGAGVRARVRRYSANACDDAPLLQFAADFRRLAISLFPACDALDDRLYGNPVQRFVLCPRLSGDRLAAAEIMNLAHPFQTLGGSVDPHDLDDAFDTEAVIDWNGRRRPADHRNPAVFWQAQIEEDHVNSFDIERIEGLSPGRALLTGYLLRDRPDRNHGSCLRARLEQVWATTWSGTQVASTAVGPWEPCPAPWSE
jgi:hypothetical protein